MAPPQLSETDAITSGRPVHLGFVEDSDAEFSLLARVFRERGTLTRWASAEDALDAIRRGSPALTDIDVLIVDLHLPGLDGIEFVRAVRELPGGSVPTISMLTSSDRSRDIDRAADAGADGYLVKPADLAGLRELPARVAAIKRAPRR